MPPPLLLQLKMVMRPWMVICSPSAMKNRAGVRSVPMVRVVSRRPERMRTGVVSVSPAKLRKILRPGSTVRVMWGACCMGSRWQVQAVMAAARRRARRGRRVLVFM